MANSKEPPQLSFKPITEGLGFHPFSDGLPYAPTVKTPANQKTPAREPREAPQQTQAQITAQNFFNGSGAVAAGRPTFVTSKASQLPPQRPSSLSPQSGSMNSPMSAHSGLNAGRISVPVALPSTAVRAPVQKSVKEEAKPTPGLQTRYGYGYLVKRILAYGLDCAFNLSLCSAVLSTVLWNQDVNPDSLVTPAVLVMGFLFLSFCNWAIITAQEVAFSTSVGKRVFGLVLHGTGMQTFIRAVYFIPSVTFAGMGLIWSLFDSKKRCWHDKAADLQPDEIAKL